MAEYIDKQIILDKCQRLIDVERKQGSDVMNWFCHVTGGVYNAGSEVRND